MESSCRAKHSSAASSSRTRSSCASRKRRSRSSSPHAPPELELLEFVPAAAVDPVFVAKTYYLGPDTGAERGYWLIYAALDDQEAAAIGRYYQKGKDRLVMVCPYRGGLALHLLRGADEVKPFDSIPLGEAERLGEMEFDLMRKIVDERWSDDSIPRSTATATRSACAPRRRRRRRAPRFRPVSRRRRATWWTSSRP